MTTEKERRPEREELAMQRTLLANERTLLAYVRTALALLGGGAALLHFFPSPPGIAVGVVLLLLGSVGGAVGVMCFLRIRKRLQQ